MNKSQLIGRTVTDADISKATAGRALDALVASITESLRAGDDIALVGFDTFAIKERAVRTGRSLQTDKEITITAVKVSDLRTGKALKDTAN